MPDLSSLTRQHPVDVTLGDGAESVTIRFDREAITPHLLDRMTTATRDGDFLASARMLEAIIIDWDLTDDGAPFPPSAENLAKLSISTLGRISELIGEASIPSDAEGNASRNTSSTPLTGFSSTPATPPNGQDHSPSPRPSESPSVT